ncbi:MAG TPA: 5-(carboxyamino)imidazole ribonucleotide synthase [Chthoniobacterales bacterium]|jgi:5-(carboxyamino)imidazole ribonucleotide synthase|nr:5-(carboxyamino)imidazole ribonucleotide synthase [Chthoniobacterales bacterium]
MENVIPPGSTIGLLGGGQLGRMFAIAARRMGYRVHTFEPSPDSPAGQISDREFNGAYTDWELLETFVQTVDVVTFEFENIPAEVVDRVSRSIPVHPRFDVLHICQNRVREKNFLRAHHYPHVPFAIVSNQAEFEAALTRIGTPAVLKSADFGYDGKGQQKIDTGDKCDYTRLAQGQAILEKWIDFELELSVICARDAQGNSCVFPASENLHTRHVLDYSIVPARIDLQVQRDAQALAQSIAHELDVVGLIAVEFFLTRDNDLIVNELAPRPHNSGHYTFDACVTSQFEQQLRAVCGLPFGAPKLFSPVVMVNLLGDLWRGGVQPDWRPILTDPYAKFHLYGKLEGRPGRKMGHFCVLRETLDEALDAALRIRQELRNADDPH